MAQTSDLETYRELLRRKPFLERVLPVGWEMFRYFKAREFHSDEYEKPLPAYCYNIFAIYRRTYFKAFPAFDEIISITDKERMATARGIEETKQVLKIDWRLLGKLIGIGTRGLRFFDLEISGFLKKEGLLDLTPKEEKDVVEMMFGKRPMKFVKAFLKSQNIDNAFRQIKEFQRARSKGTLNWNELAYQWGPEAMAEFSAGMGEGHLGVLDENGEMAGESNRANIYNFFLLTWPEIKEMLEAKPRKTMTDLHKWMMPFMRHDVVTFVDLDYLRDVCAPPSQSGIGLQLRPVSARLPRPSA